jgi:alcohol dehydrogenase (cytochrome c)
MNSSASWRAMLSASTLFLGAALTSSVLGADVTSDGLVNADKEPHNWLMNHRTYDAQRYSPLDKINKGNVKNPKLVYAVAVGGTSANENLQSTPLVEDGFMYVVDQWGVLYKIDVRSGDVGRIIWRMDPGQEKVPLSNRGAALWRKLVGADRAAAEFDCGTSSSLRRTCLSPAAIPGVGG